MSEENDKTSFDERMRSLMEEQERLEQEQQNLRGDAEKQLKTIDPQIAELKSKIGEIEEEIKGMGAKRREIEAFLAKLDSKGRHPLRRGQQAA